MHQPTAFLVMHLDVTQQPPRIDRISLYSEEKPTTNLRRFRQFTVARGFGKDYAAGIESIRKQVAGPVRSLFYWCRPFMDDDTRRRLDF